MRWRRRVFMAAALVVAACNGAGPAVTAPTGGVTLAYAGNLDGEIEPCG